MSKEEQCRRFVDRIDRPEKNWKFNEGDVKERAFWDDYMEAYEDAINATATKGSPWYCIPADNRDLNYAKYFNDGEERISILDDYTSHNTVRLDVEQVKVLLLKLDYIQEKLHA